jgi:hypothetical protein
MKNSTSNNLNEKKCGSKKTDIINKEGTLVFNWQRDPFRNGTTMCGKCYRKHDYLKARLRRLTGKESE